MKILLDFIRREAIQTRRSTQISNTEQTCAVCRSTLTVAILNTIVCFPQCDQNDGIHLVPHNLADSISKQRLNWLYVFPCSESANNHKFVRWQTSFIFM